MTQHNLSTRYSLTQQGVFHHPAHTPLLFHNPLPLGTHQTWIDHAKLSIYPSSSPSPFLTPTCHDFAFLLYFQQSLCFMGIDSRRLIPTSHRLYMLQGSASPYLHLNDKATISNLTPASN